MKRVTAALILCMAIQAGQPAAQTAGASRAVSPGALRVTVTSGPHWKGKVPLFWFIHVGSTPQIALWLEDERGYVATVFVTRRTALQDWRSRPGENTSTVSRPESLPRWINRHRRGGSDPIETCGACHDRVRSTDKTIKEYPALDTVTGASPKGSFTRTLQLPQDIKPGVYHLFAEINLSFDYNGAYQRDLPPGNPHASGVSGQPAIVWEGAITIGSTPSTATLRPLGTSHPAGLDGDIKPGLDGITTAGGIASSITATFSPSR